jgi:hypothetical protein
LDVFFVRGGLARGVLPLAFAASAAFPLVAGVLAFGLRIGFFVLSSVF